MPRPKAGLPRGSTLVKTNQTEVGFGVYFVKGASAFLTNSISLWFFQNKTLHISLTSIFYINSPLILKKQSV
jgi:hypothetical protein